MSTVEASQVNDEQQYRDVPERGKHVALLPTTGNTGKSTLAALLQAFYGARIFSLASTGQDAAQFKATIDARFHSDEVFECCLQLALCNDNAVLDVGGAGSEAFFGKILLTGFFSQFDAVVLVVDHTARSQEDMLNCLRMLRKEGLRDEQIKVLLNWKKPRESVRSQFETILAYGAEHPGVKVNSKCVIPELKFFDLVRKSGMTFTEAFSMPDRCEVVAEKDATDRSFDGIESALADEIAKHATKARFYVERAVKELQIGMVHRGPIDPWPKSSESQFGYEHWNN
jgi:hypothetical protein